jgi:hypothetical protein
LRRRNSSRRLILKKISSLLIILVIALSCREEVIEPDNFVENVNEPVQINERNSYIFLLNARELSMDLSVPAYFNSYRARFNVTLIDYETGYISIAVEDGNNKERFRYFLTENVSYHSDILDGYVLNTIKIRTENFSGKIKVEFRKTL